MAAGSGPREVPPGAWGLDSERQGRHRADRPDRRPRRLLVTGRDRLLARAIRVATRAKMLYSRAYIYAGRLYFSDQIEFVRLLPDYPNGLNDEQRSIVDSSMRATFGAM